MSPVIELDAGEWNAFSVHHPVRIVGEHQYLLGAGCLSMATNLRLQVEVWETAEEFALRVTDRVGSESDLTVYSEKWGRALGTAVLADEAAVDGLEVAVDFGQMESVLPAESLLTCPGLAGALTIAALAHRGVERLTDVGIAQMGACALAAVMGESREERFYNDVHTSIAGGAAYAEPGGQRLNVQQLLPPDACIVALAPGQPQRAGIERRDQEVREALYRTFQEGGVLVGEGAFESLFEMADGVLSQPETTSIYGLLRVRQMVDGFIEHLGEPFVDNDRLAEICDEESEILKDYFAFPVGPYGSVRRRAAEAGALGSKFTWLFGSYPGLVILAPARREEVVEALSGAFSDLHLLPVDMEPAGLRPGDAGAGG